MWVLVVLSIPAVAVIVTAGLLAIEPRHRWAGRVALGPVGLVGILTVLGMLTIGIFLLPVGVLLGVAVLTVTLDRATTSRRRPGPPPGYLATVKPMTAESTVPTTKDPQGQGEATRAAIVAAAEELLRERGYDGMTMRDVAQRAGVSLGNAYYYYSSKEQLAQGFYERLQRDHAKAAEGACLGLARLDDRIRAVLHAWLDEATPLHDFLASYIGLASAPRSPLSPFSPQSAPAREAALAMWAEVVERGVRAAPREGCVPSCPRLLWLGHLGVVMFWANDTTPGQQRTRDFVDRSTPIIGRLVRLTALPGVGRAADDLARLVRSLAV